MESTIQAGDDVPAIPEDAWPRSHVRARMRIRHLELLAALDAGGSVHAASRRLNLTQPAASKLLREIEGMFGVELFDRSRSGVTATAHGRAVIERAGLMLNLLDGTGATLAAIAGGLEGVVHVGAYAVATPVLLPGVLRLLRESGRATRVRIEEGSSDTLIAALRRGELDCVIGRVPEDVALDDLDIQPLYDEPIVLVCRPGHRLARRRGLTWADAHDCEWILPAAGAPLHRLLRSRFATMGRGMPESRVESVSVLANVSIVSGSDTLVMLPRDIAEHYKASGMIRILPLRLDAPLPPVSAILRKVAPGDAALRSFLEALQAFSARRRGDRDNAIRMQPRD